MMIFSERRDLHDQKTAVLIDITSKKKWENSLVVIDLQNV